MVTTGTALTIWAVMASVWMLGLHANALWQTSMIRRLDDLSCETPDEWPTVSVLVPARNEVDDLEEALESLCRQDYPALEIIVIDDRSTDGTGALIDSMAERDERIEAVHIEKLPDGWLGKLHALEQGRRNSTGEWLLLTDADVEHAPDTSRRAVEAAHGESADHIACIPRMRDHDFWMEAAYAAFVLGLFQLTSVRSIESPQSDDFIGIGAFNLVRRSTLGAAGGFESLRMDVADDIGVGYLVSQQNGRSRLALATDRLEVTWYEGLGAMVAGLEKNAFAGIGHYSYARVAGYSLVWLFLFFGPLVGLANASAWVFGPALAALFLHPWVGVVAARKFDRSPSGFAARLFGEWILFYVLLRSAYMCWKRGGIRWRGTTYPVEQLRAEHRVEL